jgi:hypothetical protein
MSFKKYRDIILGAAMLAFSGFYLTVAQGIKTRPKLTPAYASAKIVPTLLGVLLAILSVICIIEGVYKMKKFGTTITNGKKDDGEKGDAFAVIATFALMIVYALALPVAGFCLSTMMYLFLQISLLAPAKKRNLKLFAIVSVAFTMFVFVSFRIGLQMLLPRGVIEALLGF